MAKEDESGMMDTVGQGNVRLLFGLLGLMHGQCSIW
jgi:hypothetical protein